MEPFILQPQRIRRHSSKKTTTTCNPELYCCTRTLLPVVQYQPEITCPSRMQIIMIRVIPCKSRHNPFCIFLLRLSGTQKITAIRIHTRFTTTITKRMKDVAISFLEDHGLSPSDLPIFLIVHTALSIVLVSSTWLWCYQNPNPTFLTRRISKLAQQHPRFSFTPEKSPPTLKVQQLLKDTIPSLDATKLATSFIEAKLGRLVIKPITVPARLWLSWQATFAIKEVAKRKNKHKKSKQL